MADLSIFDTGGISIFGGVFSKQQIFNAGLLVADDQLLKLGTDADQVQLNRSTILDADTVLASVLIGTPVSQAIAANSLMIANATSNGDIAMYINDGGHSQMVFWANGDVADVALLAGSSGSVDFYIGGSKVFDLSNNGSKTTLIGLSGDYWQIGTLATNTSHSLNSANDLFIVGELEVNGTFYPNAQTLGGTLTLNGQVFDAGGGDFKVVTTVGLEGVVFESSNSSHGLGVELGQTHTTPDLNSIIARFTFKAYDHDGTPVLQRFGYFDLIHTNIGDGTETSQYRWFGMSAGVIDNQAMTLSSAGVLWIDADLTFDTAQGIKVTGGLDDGYFTLLAHDNGSANGTWVEVARAKSAADPYFSMGGSQEFKFYNSGVAELAGINGLGAVDAVTLDTDGDFTVTSSYMKVIPFGGAGSTNDSIVNIEGAAEGTVIVLRANATVGAGNDQITITDTGNVILEGAVDFVMDNVADTWTAIYDGTNWLETSRSGNA